MKNEHKLKIALPIGAALVLALALLGIAGGNQAQTAQTDNGALTNQNSVLQVKAEQGDTLANRVKQACELGGQTAKDLQDKFGACAQAIVVKQPVLIPGIPGVAGSKGDPGRGIEATDIRDNRLYIRYTDGIVEDKGLVIGSDGKPGKDGKGITGTSISGGHLLLTYSDGATVDAGQVLGKDGTNGTNGRGVTKITLTGAYHLVVTYTDGSTDDLGALPVGPQGPAGTAGANGSDGQPPAGWTTKRLDGSTETCQRAATFDFQNPYYSCTQESAPVITPTPGQPTDPVPTR